MPQNDELQQPREAYDDAQESLSEEFSTEFGEVIALRNALEAADELITVLEAQNAAQQQRIAELEAWQASAKTVLRSHTHVLQDILAPYALPGDDMEMAVGRVLKRTAAREKALEPFANMGDIFANSKTIHPSYNGQDREIYSLNDAVLTRRDFERAYEALHADGDGA